MRCLTVLCVAVFAAASAKRDWSKINPLDVELIPRKDVGWSQYNSRIVGGDEAEPNQFPYQAALLIQLNGKTAFCGGSCISDRHILTAAHCVDKASEVEVVLGAHNIKEEEPTQQRYISNNFTVHRGWNPLFLTSDIAVITLNETIKFTDEIQPIRLPRLSDVGRDYKGRQGIVSGWGKDSDQSTTVSSVLRYVSSNVISDLLCKIFYFGVPGPNHICISGRGGHGACSGDSGGPLVVIEEDGKPTLVGAVSFGLAIGCEVGWPSAFTKVPSFVSWINRETGISISD